MVQPLTITLGALLLLDACTPSSGNATSTSTSTDAARGPCAPDIAKRAPSAEPVEGFDLDGDGVRDLVFRAGHSMHGNSTYYFYRSAQGCAVYLGSIDAFMVSTPHCVKPPEAGKVCRMSASLRMFHDDYQETFYEHGPGGFFEAGHGDYITPRARRR